MYFGTARKPEKEEQEQEEEEEEGEKENYTRHSRGLLIPSRLITYNLTSSGQLTLLPEIGSSFGLRKPRSRSHDQDEATPGVESTKRALEAMELSSGCGTPALRGDCIGLRPPLVSPSNHPRAWCSTLACCRISGGPFPALVSSKAVLSPPDNLWW